MPDRTAKETVMKGNEFQLAGWLAIAAAALTLPWYALGLGLEIAIHRQTAVALGLLVPYLLVTVAHAGFGLFAFARFRTFLNRRHGFHEVDGLILTIIIGAIVLVTIGITSKVLTAFGFFEGKLILIPAVGIAVFGVTLGILGIIFAIKLIHLESDLNGLLKPYVWITIAAGICFATFILSPLGGLLDAAGNVILGMIFLKPEAEERVPDFV